MSILSPDSGLAKYNSSSFKFDVNTSPSLIINNIQLFNDFVKDFFRELLQEIYSILLHIEIRDIINIEERISDFVDNFLFEYDLDPKNIFEIIINNPNNMLCYSSLIGIFYQRGIGCKVDTNKAFEIYTKAIQDNNFEPKSIIDNFKNVENLNKIISQHILSIILYKDIISRRRVYKLHIKNAEKGDSVSQYFIGNCYYNGENIEKDYNKAFKWYSKSAEGGNIQAMHTLGLCYYDGYGVKEDKKKAYKLYLKSAKSGHRTALSSLGFCYEKGTYILKDRDKAFEFFLKAAEKGHIYCQEIVINRYKDENKLEKAFCWYRKAAINGSINAQYNLANYYLNGNFIQKNEKKAFNWYIRLANRNSGSACYFVAKFYRDGIGTDKNLDEATKWYKKLLSYNIKGKPKIDDFLKGLNNEFFE